MKQIFCWLAFSISPFILVSLAAKICLVESQQVACISAVPQSPVVEKPVESLNSSEGCESTLGLREVWVQEPSSRSSLRPDYSTAFRSSNYRNNFFMLQAFKDALSTSWQSTVQLVCDGQPCSLGTVVDADGWIVTKASELDFDQTINCILCDQREFSAELIRIFADLDLALLRIPASGLSAIEWDYKIPPQGKWLATTDSQSGVPAAIGVVSAGPVRVPSQRAVLGVELAANDPKAIAGAKVKHVLSGSGAYFAGLQKEDVIVAVNGKQINSREQLLSMLRSGQGGDVLKLAVFRDEDTVEKRVRLMDLSMELFDETEMEVNGPISARASGFTRIFMHDTVLQPNQCGGPVVNLDGKAVGINIARAGRVSTYALPADTIRPAIQSTIDQARLVSAPSALPATRVSSELAAPLATAP